MWREALTMFLTSDSVVLMSLLINWKTWIFIWRCPYLRIISYCVHMFHPLIYSIIFLCTYWRHPGALVGDTRYQSSQLMVDYWWINIINFSKLNWRYLKIMALMINDAGHQKNKLLKAVHLFINSFIPSHGTLVIKWDTCPSCLVFDIRITSLVDVLFIVTATFPLDSF